MPEHDEPPEMAVTRFKEPYTDPSDAEIKARINSLVAELNRELDKAAEAGIEAEVSDLPFQRLGRRTSRMISIKLNRPL